MLVTQWDFLNRLLATVQLSAQQFGLALLCPIALLTAWEIAKAFARRSRRSDHSTTDQGGT